MLALDRCSRLSGHQPLAIPYMLLKSVAAIQRFGMTWHYAGACELPRRQAVPALRLDDRHDELQ